MQNHSATTTINGLILAGGQARRMQGKDKGLIPFAGSSLIEYCISALAPQVSKLFISANRNIERYERFSYPVLKDKTSDYAGPLAGLLCALEMSAEQPVLVAPCDAPLLSEQLAVRLLAAYEKENRLAVIPHDGTRLQPLFGLFSPDSRASLQRYLADDQHKVETWVTSLPHTLVDFSDQAETFMNINTEEDLHKAESYLHNHRHPN